MREYAERISEICGDYRRNEGVNLDTEHVLRWASQFCEEDREFLLTESAHILERTYLSEPTLAGDVNKLVQTYATELNRRRWVEDAIAGSSHSWMLEQLRARGLQSATGATDLVFVDDIVFSGGRVFQDIRAWLQKNPNAVQEGANVLVLSLVRHAGSWNALANDKYGVRPLLAKHGMTVVACELHMVEDRKSKRDQTSHVLRPARLPQASPNCEQFCPRAGHPQGNTAFSSQPNRERFETIMFAAGLRVRDMCPNLPEHMRPLGATHLKTPGFGALYVTARNCPNNCPLAWWVGDPWIPLFKRRTNQSQSRSDSMSEDWAELHDEY